MITDHLIYRIWTPELSACPGFKIFVGRFIRVAILSHNSPEVKVHEGGEADNVVRDALDGVVVEQQPLQAVVAGALSRDLHQSVAGQIWKKEQKLETDPCLTWA